MTRKIFTALALFGCLLLAGCEAPGMPPPELWNPPPDPPGSPDEIVIPGDSIVGDIADTDLGPLIIPPPPPPPPPSPPKADDGSTVDVPGDSSLPPQNPFAGYIDPGALQAINMWYYRRLEAWGHAWGVFDYDDWDELLHDFRYTVQIYLYGVVTAVTVLQTTQFFGWYDDDDCCDDDDDDAPSIASLYGAGFYYGPGTDTVGRYPGFDTTPSRPSLIELGGFVYTGPRFEDLIRYGGYQRPDYGGYDDRRLVDTDPRGSLIDRPQIDTVPRTDKPLIDDKAKSAVRTDEPAKATTREKIAPEKPAVTPKSAAIKPDQPVSKTEGAPKRAAGAKSAKRTEQKKEKKEGKNEFHIEFYSTRGGSYSSGGSFGGPGGGGFGLGR